MALGMTPMLASTRSASPLNSSQTHLFSSNVCGQTKEVCSVAARKTIRFCPSPAPCHFLLFPLDPLVVDLSVKASLWEVDPCQKQRNVREYESHSVLLSLCGSDIPENSRFLPPSTIFCGPTFRLYHAVLVSAAADETRRARSNCIVYGVRTRVTISNFRSTYTYTRASLCLEQFLNTKYAPPSLLCV